MRCSTSWPLGTDMDKVEATPARREQEIAWDADAPRRCLDELAERQPVLVRISAAKRLRCTRAEADARKAGSGTVARDRRPHRNTRSSHDGDGFDHPFPSDIREITACR